MAWTATLLSTPSRSQMIDRRASLIQAFTALGPGGEAMGLARPAPMALCRQAAVGPSAMRSAPATRAAPVPTVATAIPEAPRSATRATTARAVRRKHRGLPATGGGE